MSWQAPGYAHRLELGGGKTGRAFLAATEESGELVVIKYLSVDTTYAEQVRAELSELSSLDSAYFVSVREVIQADEGVAIVMDPINGASLRALLRDSGALTAEAALLVFHDTLAGLAAAHSAGIVHGDYRPENVMVDLTGSCVLLDARAASWIDRDITLGSGVYLAPERWHAGALTAEADTYAATVTFSEMLVGEPPYWEDSQLLALRYRHEQEDIPVGGIPVPLRELLRLGMAKEAEERATAAALLAVVEVTAIAEYGADWAASGRTALIALLSSRQLAFGVDAIEETEVVAAGELVELDDYYTGVPAGSADAAAVAVSADEVVDVDAVAVDETVSVGEVAVVGDAASADEFVTAEVTEVEIEAIEIGAADAEAVEEVAAAEVVAAAAEIVELAGIEELTVAEAAAEEDVLTAEEESAVAEVEEMVAAVEAGVVVGTVWVEGMEIAATESEIVEIDETVVEGVEVASAVFTSENAAGAFEEGAVAEALIAEGAAAEGVVAGELTEEENTGEILVAEEGSAAGSVVAGAAIGGALIGGTALAAGVATGGAAAIAAAGIAAGAAAGGVVAAGEGESSESETAGEASVGGSAAVGAVVGVAGTESGGVATGIAKVGPPSVAIGEARVPFRRKHPWLVGSIAILIVIIIAGVAFGLTGGLSGSPSAPRTPEAAITETATNGGVLPPASKSTPPTSGPSAGTPSGSGTPAAPVVATPGESPSAPSSGPAAPAVKPSPSHKPRTSHKPTPTPTKLPVTGSSTGYTFGLAGLLLAVGIVLVVVARRRRA